MSVRRGASVSVLVPWARGPVPMLSCPFYSHRETEPGCQFSNLYPAVITIQSDQVLRSNEATFLVSPQGPVTFPSTENAFQCAKAQLPLHQDYVRQLNPAEAARAGQGRFSMNARLRDAYTALGGTPTHIGTGKKRRLTFSTGRHYPRRPDWTQVKREVMAIALKAKFEQHPQLWDGAAQAELPTFFIEHTANDAQWGDGGDGQGTNFLGKLLTALLWRVRTGTPLQEDDADFERWIFRPNAQVAPELYRV